MTILIGFPLLLFLIVWPISPGALGERHRRVPPIYMNQFAVHVPNGGETADNVADKYGFQNLGQIGSLKNFYLFQHQHVHRRSLDHNQEHFENLDKDPEVAWFQQQHEKKRKKRDFATNFGAFLDDLETLPLTVSHGPQRYRTIGHIESFSDPLFKEQWYLNGGAKDGHDMNVAPAWQRGYTGKGVVVSILDDGIQTNHPDLALNYDPHASTDINDNDNDPMPRDNGDNKHGTRCAGEVAAVAFNGYCGVGVAYNASIGGVRMLDGTVNDAVEAKALGLNPEHIDIYSASWGPEDDGKTVDGPGPLARRAFIYGVTSGRKGKGSIYIWASGNGGRHIDSCNCDGYTNSIFTVSISSATQGGFKPWYLEECSSTLATTYSSGTPGHDKSVATVDMDGKLRPDHICTVEHTGTSASAPLAAGIAALALEANPSLTWRDMQYLVILSSKSAPLEKENGWIVNGVKRKVSHKFGYGLMDAGAMVTLAEQWTNVPPQHICKSQEINEERQLDPTLGAALTVHMDATGCANTLNEVRFLEHVQCKISLRFFPRGNMRILLTSPMGTTSTLLFERPRDVVSSNFDDWPFLSVHYWGEKAEGRWTLQIINGGTRHVNQPGFLKKWQLIFYGTATNPIRLRNNNGASSFAPVQPPTSSGTFIFPNNHRPSANGVPFYSSSTEGAGSGVFGSNGFPGFSNIFNVAGSNPQVAIAPLDGSPNGDFPGQQHNLMTAEESGKKILHICDPECDPQGCYGKGPTQCVACKHYKLDNSCVSRCPPRSFPNQAGQCWPCHESCETCAGPGQDSCLTCAPAHLRVTDLAVCLQQCPEGYFEKYDEELCVPCESNCASCLERPDHCTSCDHHLVLHKNKCYASCPLNTYETEEYECADCHNSCETCNGSSETQCVSCKPGRFSLVGTCITRCPTGYYADKKRRECLPCAPGCLSCSASLCYSCEPGWINHKSRCLPEGSSKCDSAEFSESGRCRPCHSTCESCTGPGPSDCLTCTSPLLVNGRQCVAACPRGTYPHRSDCLPCLHTCTECEARANCTACVPGLHLQSGECRASCAQGYYSDRGVCAKCYLSCHTCSGPRRDQCVSCPKSWQLAAGECHPECPEGFFKTEFGCQKCHHYCRTCNGEGPLQCTTCPAKYMLEGGLCMECLGSQYYDPPTQLCKSCHETCRQCNGPGPFSCMGCLYPLHLEKLNNQCVSCCPLEDASISTESGNQTPSLNSLVFTSSQNCCHCDKISGECQNSSPAGKRRIAAGADRLLSSSSLNNYERTSVSESFNVVPNPKSPLITDTLIVGAGIIVILSIFVVIFSILLMKTRSRYLRYNGNTTGGGYEKLPTQLKVEVNDSNAISLSDDYEEEEDEANPLYTKT